MGCCSDQKHDMDQSDRRAHLPHLGPSYGMDFDRDYAQANAGQGTNPYLPPLPMGNGSGSGMNDISALAAAASDQLYELERHEAFRRAEYELRHRQIAAGASGRSKSNGGSPSASTPNAYGFTDRERFAQGAPAPGGGQIVFPLSAPQPATANHPAVPAGTLADPTYLVPPSCCHEECHKSYRKRLKVARQTAACPNCLTPAHGVSGSHGSHGSGGAGHGNGGEHGHSSNSSTPKDRSNIGSSEDLTKLGGNAGGNAIGGNSYHLHHASLQQQLARLQQQHTMSLQKNRAAAQHKSSAGLHHHMNPYPVNMHHHRSSHASLAPSADVSRAASPSTDDDSDDGMANVHGGSHHDYSHTSPVLASMRGMSLFPGRNAVTAPVSIAASPVGSRATSPVEGHSASSGKHGHASHTARDAKTRSHPYGGSHAHNYAGSHHHHHSAHGSVPNSPHVHATKSRMSPPKLPEPHSGHKSVEEILNSGSIPPPNRSSERTLPPPNSGYSSVASLSYSLTAGSAHGSPAGSRSSSPVHSTHSSSNSHLANSVRQAFGMTPMFRGSDTPSTNNPSPKSVMGGLSPPPKLAPLGVGNVDVKPSLPSFSRGPSPVHLMELDGAA